MHMYSKLFAAVILAFTQYGCGGGGDYHTALVTDAQGFYHGTTSKNQEITALVLDDGSFYAYYTNREIPDFDRVLMGLVEASGGKLSSLDVMDYDLTHPSFKKVAISASYGAKSYLTGTSAGVGVDKESITFTADYDAGYEKTPTLAAIAADYKGVTQGLKTKSDTDVSITTTGDMTFASGTCKAKGTIAARTSGNMYSVKLKFDASSPCEYANQTLSGIATLDDDGSTLMMFARAADTSRPLAFQGDRR